MRRTFWFALMIPLLLSGCAGRQDAEELLRWQERLSAAGEISFMGEITASGASEVLLYTAEVLRTGEETRVRVIQPETIAGITFRSGEEGPALEFDGLILELAPGQEERISPCRAGILFLDAAARGQLLYSGRDGEHITAAFSLGEETVSVRLTGEYVPVCAEIRRGENVELILRVERWEMKE